jgi:hypothetical protein
VTAKISISREDHSAESAANYTLHLIQVPASHIRVRPKPFPVCSALLNCRAVSTIEPGKTGVDSPALNQVSASNPL